MSKTGVEDDEGGGECFYESLDRIVSSSCSCSTSNSDNDNDSYANSPSYAPEHPFPIPKFPMGVSKYDVWVSEPSSVLERRTRLLREMGLSADTSLSRVKPIFDLREKANGEFGRSVSYDQLSRQEQLAAIVRSKSDGAADRKNSLQPSKNGDIQCNSSSSVDSPPILSNCLVNETGSFVNNRDNVLNLGSGSADGFAPAASSASLKIPPSAKAQSNSLPTSVNAGGGEIVEDLDRIGIAKVNDQVYTIKDLDNGKEFVVNEIREDGMWNKVKEVGTGRQLTMEEFEMCVGNSPIVQELMRRQNVEDGYKESFDSNANGVSGSSSKLKKKGGWFRSIKNVTSTMAGHKERRSSDERDTLSDKGGRRSSSATDDSQDVSFHGPEKVRVRQYGKTYKELTALYKSQEIQAHNGAIWSIKFSLDGKYLGSAGEDRVIHVWQVVEMERKGDLLIEKQEEGTLNILSVANGSPEPTASSPNVENHLEKKRRGRTSLGRKSLSLDHIVVPETVFGLSEKPICSLQGHLADVLDLSWSKSQQLLSSSMDKTVRLWDLSSKSCLKIFSHSDYVTCIQFNPIDDQFFISGSLDAKVRIWSVPDRQVIDWSDLHEMVTAACFTPDGQGALVGSYKGSCRLYDTSESKMQQKSQINLQNKKKRSYHKKITGFQFAPGNSSEVFVTSADSRIRVVDGVDLVHKFKGFRNTNSQISAYLAANGKYVISASEDSHVYVWKHEADSRPNRNKGVTVTHSYEHFHCQDVSVAIPWPGTVESWGIQDTFSEEVSTANHPPTPVEEIADGNEVSQLASGCFNSPLRGTISGATHSYFFDKLAATWPEEKLVPSAKSRSRHVSVDLSNGVNQSFSAWGMVIVTAGLRGEIRTFQNFGLPVRI